MKCWSKEIVEIFSTILQQDICKFQFYHCFSCVWSFYTAIVVSSDISSKQRINANALSNFLCAWIMLFYFIMEWVHHIMHATSVTAWNEKGLRAEIWPLYVLEVKAEQFQKMGITVMISFSSNILWSKNFCLVQRKPSN